MQRVPESTVQQIERHFHAVIMGRVAELIRRHELVLPSLKSLLQSEEKEGWFPVPDMYGGFKYWFEGNGSQTKLVSESWCRVVDGSEQRHEITAQGSRLVREGPSGLIIVKQGL